MVPTMGFRFRKSREFSEATWVSELRQPQQAMCPYASRTSLEHTKNIAENTRKGAF